MEEIGEINFYDEGMLIFFQGIYDEGPGGRVEFADIRFENI